MANLKLWPHWLTHSLTDSPNYKEMLSHLKIEYPWWNNPIDFSDNGIDTLSGILFLVDQTCSDQDGDIIKEWSDYGLIEDHLNVCSHLGLGSDAEFTLTKWKGGA